eukprot:gene5549-6111_t
MMTDQSSPMFLAKTLGLHGHWGLSSPFDFVEALNTLWKKEEKKTTDSAQQTSSPLHILLIHPNDIRHIVHTIARLNQHHQVTFPEIHFYLLENPMEVLTRDLLLLEVFLDFELPIRQRANLFLEVYGNLFIQRRTSLYLENLAQRLRHFLAKVTDIFCHILDLSLLNHRQRDELEACLKQYDRSEVVSMNDYFDHRKRGLYEDRYDSRKALVDWDYHQSIRPKASIIHIKQYKEWRETGIAYQFGDQSYTETNPTLLSYTEGTMKAGKEKGVKKQVRGYWGDIVCSPYFAFGIDCDTPNKLAEGLFEILNKDTGTEQHRHHAVEVALHSLFSSLYALEHDAVYQMTQAHDIFSGLGEDGRLSGEKEDGEEEATPSEKKEEPRVVELAEGEELPTEQTVTVPSTTVEDEQVEKLAKALERADNIHSCLAKVKLFPMSGSVKDWIGKGKLKGHFDAVFVSSRSAEVVGQPGFDQLFRSSPERPALLAMETAKFLVPFAQKTKTQVASKIEELATSINLERIEESPVLRRRRDERDLEDDVLFFKTKAPNQC